MNLQELENKKEEIKKQISKFSFPLYYQEVLKLEKLKKELKEIQYKIFILQTL